MAFILTAILIISFFDLRVIIKEKQPKAFAVFVVLALVTICYAYYYTTHVYTASVVKIILDFINFS